MIIEITVPRLGWTMEEGTFVGWLKKDGESVRAGETLFTLDGDKALQEIEATESGTLRVPPSAPKPGSTRRVGAVLGYLGTEGERLPGSTSSPVSLKPDPVLPKVSTRATVASRHAAPAPQTSERSSGHRAISPRALRAAHQL